MTPRLSELPYHRDTVQLFACFANEPWSIFLDSGHPYINYGRYDIITTRPYITAKTVADTTEITYSNGHRESSAANPFSIIATLLGDDNVQCHNLPFAGGALGYFAYDLGRRLEQITSIAERDIAMPDMAIGIYDWAVVIDHHQRKTWLAGYGKDPSTFKQWRDIQAMLKHPPSFKPTPFSVCSQLHSNMDDALYAKTFNKIKRYIRQGDCYQVNLAQRFSIDVKGSLWTAYVKLRKLNPAPYSGFFNIPEGAVLSTSPERFLKITNKQVESKPIKGTRARSSNPLKDKMLREELIESKKDRAENLMIVDLIRNDIGKSCRYGSVSVTKLFDIESFAKVHHLVSTVVGQLHSTVHVIDLLQGCFPGGSITGAPKLRAMEIIEELEPHRRSVYCGSMAYIGFDGNMDSNIAIRTLLYHQEKIYCWAGGGIVIDSKLDNEYQECFDKASALLSLFGHDNLGRLKRYVDH